MSYLSVNRDRAQRRIEVSGWECSITGLHTLSFAASKSLNVHYVVLVLAVLMKSLALSGNGQYVSIPCFGNVSSFTERVCGEHDICQEQLPK